MAGDPASVAAGDPQGIKRIAASAYNYELDQRWAEYWSNVLIPPHMASRSDVVDHFKHKFYQRFIDPDLIVQPMASTTSSSPSRVSARSSSPEATESAKSGPSNRTSLPQSRNPRVLQRDPQLVLFFLNAWVLVLVLPGILPGVLKSLSEKAYGLSLLGTISSSFYAVYTSNEKPRAWNLPAFRMWCQSIMETKEFIHFLYCLTFFSAQLNFKLALVPVSVWALEHVIKFLRHNFAHYNFYRNYLEAYCLWVDRRSKSLNVLASFVEITLGFLLIISLFSWRRSILQTFFYWQLLKRMYHTPPAAGYHQSAWAKISQTLAPYVNHYTPFLNRPIKLVQSWWLRR